MKKIKRTIEEVIDIEEKMDQKFLIVGDFNARIGQEDTEEEEGRKRRSQDTLLNQGGKILLEICSKRGLLIMNGKRGVQIHRSKRGLCN